MKNNQWIGWIKIKKVSNITKVQNIVQEMKNFHASPVGYQYQVFFTMKVDGNLATFASHIIANYLEKEIIKRHLKYS